jgi:hypothetical protein
VSNDSELPPVRWLLQTLDWLYSQALEGLPGAEESIEQLAHSYRARHSGDEDAISALASWQIAKAGIAGFVTNIGGVLTLPVAVPANVASVLYVQIRMVASIAHLRGYDLRQDQVRTFVFACLAGSAAFDILKEFGIRLGSQLTRQMILRVSGELLLRINRAVGFRLVTKAGSKGLINLVRIVPVVSGFVAGGLDAAATKVIAKAAKDIFQPNDAAGSDPSPT